MNKHLEKLISIAEEYERGNMMRSDSEIEIDLLNGEIWVSDYSEERGSFEPITKICNADEINVEDIINICDDHCWAYCL